MQTSSVLLRHRMFWLWLVLALALAVFAIGPRECLYADGPAAGQGDAPAADPADEDPPEFKAALQSFRDGLYFQAIDQFTAFWEKNPQLSRPLDYRGLCYMRVFEYDKALADFQKGLEINPKNHSLRMSLSLFHFVTGDMEKSREYLSATPTEWHEEFPCLTQLLKGPFVDEFPSTYVKFEGLTPKKRYWLYSDVGFPEGDKRNQLKKAFPGVDPKSAEAAKSAEFQKAVRKESEWEYIALVQEMMYEHYADFFGWKEKPKVTFKTYVFSTRGQFEKWSKSLGHPVETQVQGYYHPTYKILMLYNDITASGQRKGVGNEMLSTLFHESFHQFLDQLVANAPNWFNEGIATYFEQAQISTDGKKINVGGFARDGKGYVSRYEHIKEMFEHGSQWKWKEFMRFTDDQWGERSLDAYAQSWSMIYFMMNNKELKNDLKKYFHALRECKGNEYAIQKAFGDDARIDEIDKAWREFMRRL